MSHGGERDPWAEGPGPQGGQPGPWQGASGPQAYGSPGYGPPGYGPRFDPSDPLVSNDYSGWWQRVIEVIRRGWRTLLLIQLVSQVPMVLLLVPVWVWSYGFVSDLVAQAEGGVEPDFRAASPGFLVLLATVLVAVLVYTAAQLATARAVVAIATGRPASVGAELAAGARRLPAYVGWLLLTLPIVLVAFCFCVLPIFYVGAVLMLLQAVVMFERGNAIARCFQLFHHDIGAAAGRIATAWGISLAIGMILSFASFFFQAIGAAGPAATPNLVGGVVSVFLNLILSLATVVLVQPMLVLAYADLRARREGLTAGQLTAEAYR
jgi:hypothetical protein